MLQLLFFIPFFLCWGSFLNVLAYRLIREESVITPRSACPHCGNLIYWYDNIPVLSWLLLKGKCRRCHQPISWLYPFIEIFTTIILSLLYFYIPTHFFFGYFIFFSALIVTIRSDIETMLISRYMTIFLIPISFVISGYGLIPLTLQESICGTIFGYFFLMIINGIFKYIRNIDGIGQGDYDVLAFIGSFTGIIGCWTSITIGSILGSLYGIIMFIISQHKNSSQSLYTTKIPFGPFLAIGALLFVFIQKYIFCFIMSA